LFRYFRGLYSRSDEIIADSKTDQIHWYKKKDVIERYTMAFVMILNVIIIPCFSVMVISPECFKAVFFTTSSVQSVYSTLVCNQYYFSATGYHCLQTEKIPQTTSYTPPFLYSFQCSSSILRSYALIYVYTGLVVGLLTPLAKLILKIIYDSTAPESLINSMVVMFIPTGLRSIDQNFPLHGKILFDRDKFIYRISRSVLIMSIFGAMFPPLAVTELVSLYCLTAYEQLAVARTLTAAFEANAVNYSKVIERECRDTLQVLVQIFWLVHPTACIFYAFFLFDIISDAEGTLAAVFAPVIMIATPFIVYLLVRVYNKFGSGRVIYDISDVLESNANVNQKSSVIISEVPTEDVPATSRQTTGMYTCEVERRSTFAAPRNSSFVLRPSGVFASFRGSITSVSPLFQTQTRRSRSDVVEMELTPVVKDSDF
jgi:hypothetical protein